MSDCIHHSDGDCPHCQLGEDLPEMELGTLISILRDLSMMTSAAMVEGYSRLHAAELDDEDHILLADVMNLSVVSCSSDLNKAAAVLSMDVKDVELDYEQMRALSGRLLADSKFLDATVERYCDPRKPALES